MNITSKKYYFIATTLFIGLILLIYGILNPIKPINTFNGGNKEITIIEVNKISKPNYMLFFGISLSALSILLFSFDYLAKMQNHTKSQNLTNKETKILELLKQGKTNKEIASELFISVSTVKTHINNIFKKMNISNRNELIAKNYKD